MSVEPGVYSLRHFQSDSVLGVDDADWNMGDVECWPCTEANTNPNDQQFHRILIAPNPEHEGAYNLLNLRAGAYIIHSSKGVHAKATCSHAQECLWIPHEVEKHPGKAHIFMFQPLGDNKKYLGSDDPKDKKSKVVLVAPDNPKKNKSIWWKLESTPMDKKKIADWMSMVEPQDTKLSMLTIPGTHQTIALNKGGKGPFAIENPHCQNHSPYLQLCNGIRFFDLRLDHHPYESDDKDSKPGLIARHGVHPVAFVWEGYSFSAVMQSVATFLQEHPGETILIAAKMEGDTEWEPKKWADTYQSEVHPFKDYFHQVDEGKGIVDVSLDEARGKAIMFSGAFRGGLVAKHGRFPPPLNNNLQVWVDKGKQKFIKLEGPPEQLSVSEFPQHGERMSKHLEDISKDNNSNHFHWLGLNSSGKPAVGIAAGELYNPIDYTTWVDKNWVPKHKDEKKHPKGQRLGLVTFDFYEMVQDFVNFLVERNPGVNV